MAWTRNNNQIRKISKLHTTWIQWICVLTFDWNSFKTNQNNWNAYRVFQRYCCCRCWTFNHLNWFATTASMVVCGRQMQMLWNQFHKLNCNESSTTIYPTPVHTPAHSCLCRFFTLDGCYESKIINEMNEWRDRIVQKIVSIKWNALVCSR